MQWDQRLVDQLDLAFNESTVCGLAFDAAAAEARLRLDVLALPEIGPVDPDPRRTVVFSSVSSIEVTLRADRIDSLGPVLPIQTLNALDAFFAGMKLADAMYGWSFVDVQDVDDVWNVTPSLLSRSTRQHTAGHTVRWFTECGRPGPGEDWERYLVQGIIRFDDLRVERADATPVPLTEFVAAARRWWDAFSHHDTRLSAAAQPQANAQALSWRTWNRPSTMVPGTPP